MKKILFSVLMLFMASAFFSVHAQSQDLQEEMQTLVQRVDSLEHELSYLKLEYQLNRLKSDISMFVNKVDTRSIEMRLYLYNRDFDSKLGDVYQQFYETYQQEQQSYSTLIKSTKTLFILKVITYPYSELEQDMLKAYYNSIDEAYNSLEKSMDLLKLCIDEYKKFL